MLLPILFIFCSKMASLEVNFNAYKTLIQLDYHTTPYDVCFSFKNGRELLAHRKLLSKLSPVFETELSLLGNDLEDGEEIQINIVKYEQPLFDEFLQYFYTNKLRFRQNNVAELLQAAIEYDLADVVGQCIQYMVEDISWKYVINWLDCAITHEFGRLETACRKFISQNTFSVLQSELFLQCNEMVLMSILELDTIECAECDVFDACIKWAKTKCVLYNRDDKNFDNIREQLKYCLHLIRTGEMTLDEMKGRQDQIKKLLYPEEYCKLLWEYHGDDRLVNSRQLTSTGDTYYSFHFEPKQLHEYKNPLISRLYFSLSKAVVLTGIKLPPFFDDDTYGQQLCPFGLTVTIRIQTAPQKNNCNKYTVIPKTVIPLADYKPGCNMTSIKHELLQRDQIYELYISMEPNHEGNIHEINSFEFESCDMNGIDLFIYNQRATSKDVGYDYEYTKLTVGSPPEKVYIAGLQFKKLEQNSLTELALALFFCFFFALFFVWS